MNYLVLDLNNFYFYFTFEFKFEMEFEMRYDSNDDQALLIMVTWHYQKGDHCSLIHGDVTILLL